MTAKNPRQPRTTLVATDEDVVSFDRALWRIHRVAGPYRQRWDELRTVGPLDRMQWDPHPVTADQPPQAVSYCAADLRTVVAEVFHDRRRIVLSDQQALVGWVPARPLRLLSLLTPETGVPWALRNGASASLDSAPRSTCRAWARAIAQTWPDLDGLLTRSTVTGQEMVVLFAAARDSFGPGPAFSRLLSDPGVAPVAVAIAAELGWRPPLRV